MGKARKAVSWVVGGIQCGLGGLSAVLAFLVYASTSLRDALAITFQEMYLYMFLLLVFSMFSILSGLLLIHREKDGN
ncbi:hypothetical protein HXY33_04100 [Candidatus Bathyarchaeota archaeon]|nr:hypothetical protein [Candidatus Bathyarchaeota archaeon]